MKKELAANLKPGTHVWIGQTLRYLTSVRTFDGRTTLTHGGGVVIVRADSEVDLYVEPEFDK